MSQFASNHQKFWAIHRKCQSDHVDIAKTVKQLLTYPQVVQQMIVTHLIYLYSHYASDTQTSRWYYPASSSTTMTQDESKKCMFNLRQVVHALAHNDPHPQKHYKVKLNAWQQHLLQHYEVLAPFPEDMTSEAEVFALMWGNEWHKDLEIQKDYNFINLPRLTGYAREFGFSFDEIWFFIRSFQPDRKPLTPIAVNLACKAFVNISERILRKVGADTEQPPTVELNIYALGGQRRGDPYFPNFLETPPTVVRRGQVPTRVAAADRYTPSGFPRTHINYPVKIRSLEHFDNSSYDPRAGRRNAKNEPESVRKGRMSYLETPSPPPPSPSVLPAAAGPLHAAVMENPSVLQSRVVSVVSQKLAELQTRHAALIQQLTQQKEEQQAKEARIMAFESNRAMERRQQELELRLREERLVEREKEVEEERGRLATERKKRDDEQLAEKERTGQSMLEDQGLNGRGFDDNAQTDYSGLGYGLDDHQPNAMDDNEQVMAPAGSATGISGWTADPQPRTTIKIGQVAGEQQMVDIETDNVMNSGVEKHFVMYDALHSAPVTPSKRQRRAPPIFATGIPAQVAAVVSEEVTPVVESAEDREKESAAVDQNDGEVNDAAALINDDDVTVDQTSNDVDMDNSVPQETVDSNMGDTAPSSVKIGGDDMEPRTEDDDNSNNQIALQLAHDSNHSIAPPSVERNVESGNKGNQPPSMDRPTSAGQKRSAEEAEVDAEQEGRDKRSKTDDSADNSELRSAIEILTAASRPVLAPSLAPNLPTSSTSGSAIPPFNTLSDVEVASLRALLGHPSAPQSSASTQAEEGRDNEEEAAFGRVRVSLENVAEAVREMERGYEVSVRIGRKADGRFTCSAPEEKMSAGSVEQSSSADEFTDAQETTLQQKLDETRQEAKRLAEGESLVIKATRKVNGRFLYAIIVE